MTEIDTDGSRVMKVNVRELGLSKGAVHWQNQAGKL